MASAARGQPPKPGPSTAALSDDLKKLQAEILNGFDSDEDEAPAVAVSDDSDCVQLTEAVILQASGEEVIEDITQLVFRDNQLRSLSTPRTIDFERLVNLEILSLSHNLLEDIEPLAMLVVLVEVNLNFNRIIDLSPLCECELLEKLFVSHNKVETIEGLEDGCPKLRELSLYANDLEDTDEVMEVLRGLPDLRMLHIAENVCCAAPSQRYRLLCDLPELEVFDGQKITSNDRKFATAFLEAARRGEAEEITCGSADLQVDETLRRPVTAPSICARPRPPLAPSQNNVVASALAPLAGQKLRSSRANRIDDVLTQSREASPEIILSRIPTLDLQSIDRSDPNLARKLLSAHFSALQQCLDTMQIDRENLRFQVRLLQEEHVEQQMEKIRADIERLEVENRSTHAVQSEHAQLQARLAEVDRQLSGSVQTASCQRAGPVNIGDSPEDDDAIDQLRWENSLLEKRLDRMKKFSEQSRHNCLSAQVRSRQSSSQGVHGAKPTEEIRIDPELHSILADNEAMLRRLHGDVSQTAAGKPLPSSVRGGLAKHMQNSQVDVLTIGSEGSDDVEWHRKT